MAKILIVDDEERIREVVKEYALISGYEVAEACDGLEAIEQISNNDFDCVILDIMMPRQDGLFSLQNKALPLFPESADNVHIDVALPQYPMQPLHH